MKKCSLHPQMREGFAMTVAREIRPSDALYGTDLLVTLEGVKKWLDNEKHSDWFFMNRFHHYLEDIVKENPYLPVYKPGEKSLFLSTEEQFKYRRPVWALIGFELSRVIGKSAGEVSPTALSLRFMEVLKLCIKYRRYEDALLSFGERVKEIGLSFCSHPVNLDFDQDQFDVFVLGDFKEKGENAIEMLKKVVDGLTTSLSEHIEK